MGGMMIGRGNKDNPRNTCPNVILSAKISANILGLSLTSTKDMTASALQPPHHKILMQFNFNI
jgi:hypothetical protein